MIIKANIKEAIRSLAGARQRTFLALLGIIIGIGSVIAMVSIGTIVQNEALRQFKDMGTDILSIRKEMPSGSARAGGKGFFLGDVLAMPLHCGGIGEVAPYTSCYGRLKFKGKRTSIPALGITESAMDLFKLRICSVADKRSAPGTSLTVTLLISGRS